MPQTCRLIKGIQPGEVPRAPRSTKKLSWMVGMSSPRARSLTA
jgi:hypothetical protein